MKPTRPDPDADAIALARGGDPAGALRLVMARHGKAVYRYCREALHDAALADDVHQQVFIEVYRDLPRFEGRAPLRIWLFAVARNRVLDAVRRRHRWQDGFEELDGVDAPDPRPAVDETIDDARMIRALHDSLAELPADVRAAVLLRHQQGFTFEEMAQIYSEKPGTLSARVKRALPRLRAAIERRLMPGARRPARSRPVQLGRTALAAVCAAGTGEAPIALDPLR